MYYLSGKLIINIMKAFILIIATLILNEPVVDESKIYVRDPELRGYVMEFLTELEDYDVDYDKSIPVAVRFSKVMSMGVAGAAYGMRMDDETNVVVNKRIWKHLNDDQKRWLVFHELSHDMFDITHWSTPIMHPKTPTAREAKSDWEYNKKMLFITIRHR